MKRTFLEAIKHRRSYYELSGESTISDKEIIEIVQSVVKHVPSAFNSQTTRIVILFNEKHKRLWDIAKEVLRAIVPEEKFPATKNKIEKSFQSGYGTILFYEDSEKVAELQERFPTYADNFPVWSHQTSGMHQFSIWTMLEDAGMGASIQHYNPLIDKKVAAEFNIPPHWKLIAQMPFGKPLSEPGEKQFMPLEDRILIP